MLTENEKNTFCVPAVCTLLGKYAVVALLACAMFCIFKNFFIRFGTTVGIFGILCAMLAVSLIVVLPFIKKD